MDLINNKRTILFILPFMPYPLESGGHQALYNGIKAVKDSYNVLVTYPAIDNDDYRQNESAFVKALPGISVLPILSQEEHLSTSQRIYQNTKNFVKKLLGIKAVPYIPNVYDGWISSVSPLSEQWREHLDRIFSNYKIDIAQVEMPWMIAAVYNLPSYVKKVFVHHEIAFVRHRLELGNNPSTTAIAHADLTKMVEIHLLNKYDAIITLSQTDKQKLIDVGVTVPIYPSFAVVDTAMYHTPDRTNKILSFVGPESHNPNYIGVMWFLNNCWNQLKSIDNSYSFRIVGKWSDKSQVTILSHFNDVEFLGFVNDLGKVIDDTIMIVPITIGSGIRMKILEAASRGVPVVSTSVGAEGLPVTDGVHCIIKDNPDDFVNGILSLQDQRLANSLCESAYEIVYEHYSINALCTNRQSIIQKLFIQN